MPLLIFWHRIIYSVHRMIFLELWFLLVDEIWMQTLTLDFHIDTGLSLLLGIFSALWNIYPGMCVYIYMYMGNIYTWNYIYYVRFWKFEFILKLLILSYLPFFFSIIRSSPTLMKWALIQYILDPWTMRGLGGPALLMLRSHVKYSWLSLYADPVCGSTSRIQSTVGHVVL